MLYYTSICDMASQLFLKIDEKQYNSLVKNS